MIVNKTFSNINRCKNPYNKQIDGCRIKNGGFSCEGKLKSRLLVPFPSIYVSCPKVPRSRLFFRVTITFLFSDTLLRPSRFFCKALKKFILQDFIYEAFFCQFLVTLSLRRFFI
jgi:hypothetical protein